MAICPTLKQLLELEYQLFTYTQYEQHLPEAEFDKAEASWDKAFKKVKALGGIEIVLLEEPEA